MSHFFFVEDVIGFNISVYYFSSWNKLKSSSQLIGYLHCFLLFYWSFFCYHIVQVTVGAELEDHDHVMLCQETIVDSGGEETVGFRDLGELF